MNKKTKLEIALSLLSLIITTEATDFIIKKDGCRLLLIPVMCTFYHIENVCEICKPLNLSCFVTVENNKAVMSIF
jgi:hypothetical protein